MTESRDPAPPRSDRYRVDDEVARGGMGVIYKAWDEELRRHLALKVMLEKPDSGSGTRAAEQLRARFLEEAQVTGQLDHPGVVPVHELGVDADGRRFFSMRLVKGRTLAEVFDELHARGGDRDLTRALGVMIKVCETMAFAHDKGVVHRDLKPANVMVGRFGETYVMDWGLAKVTGREDVHDVRLREASMTALSVVHTERRDEAGADPESPLVTMDGDVVGTPAYMSPEQAAGRIEEVGPVSDVYSVGAMLYHLLTGRPPYTEPGGRVPPHTVLKWVLEGPPTAIQQIAPDVPDELVAICDKAMARDPRERYPSMLALEEDLQAFIGGRVVRAYQTGAWAELKKWYGRNRALAATVAAALLLIVAGTSTAALVLADKNLEISAARDEALEAQLLAQENEQRALDNEALAREHEADALRQSYIANLSAAAAGLELGAAEAARQRLAATSPDLRGWEWEHLTLRADPSLTVLGEQPSLVLATAWSPDGTLLATASGNYLGSGTDDFDVRLWDPDTGEELAVLEGHYDSVRALAFSPNGRSLLSAAADGTFIRWDLESRTMLSVPEYLGVSLDAADWFPDGRRIALGCGDGTVRIWDLRYGEAVLATRLAESVRSLAVAPDGSRVAVGLRDDSVVLLDPATGDEVRRFRARTADAVPPQAPGVNGVLAVEFVEDGRALMTAGGDGLVRRWDLSTGELKLLLRGHSDPVTGVAASPNGLWIASGSTDGTLRLWDARDGQPLEMLYGHDAPVTDVAYSPDGARIATSSFDRTVRLWDGQPGSAVTRLDGESPEHGRGFRLTFGPEGNRLAWRPSGSTVRVSDARTGESLFTLPPQRGDVLAIAFSPDGERLLTVTAGGGLRIWDARAGTSVRALPIPGHDVWRAAFSPDASVVAVTTQSRLDTGWTAHLRSTQTGEPVLTLGGLSERVDQLRFTPSGYRLVVLTRDELARVFDTRTGELLGVRRPDRSVGDIVFRSDDVVLTVSPDDWDKSVRIGPVLGDAEPRVLRGRAQPDVLALLPDGSRFATGNADGTISIWSPDDGELIGLTGHRQAINDIAFSPDGRRLASADWTGTLLVWDTVQPRERYAARREAADRRELAAAARALVDPLLEELLVADDVVARLLTDRSLDPRLREAAIREVRNRTMDPETLRERANDVVRRVDASPEEYAQALRWAEAADRVEPDHSGNLTSLGWARIRSRLFDEAVAPLQRSDEIARELWAEQRLFAFVRPFNAGGLALCYAALGRADEALEQRALLLTHIEDIRTQLDERWLLRESLAVLDEVDAALGP